MCKTMKAVINRTMSRAERRGPSLRSSDARLGLAKEISAAIPAHCKQSVSITRKTAVPASRTKLLIVLASLHRGFCKCEPDPGAHSTEPERVPTQHQNSWSRLSAPPSSLWRRLDSASPRVGPRLQQKTQVAPVALGTLCLCGTRPVRPRRHGKPAEWSADKPALLPVAAPP